jgi:enoyl reductase-like protein
MKPSASRIERMLEKIEAKLVPPERKWLRAIVRGDDEAEAKEKALAEHIAAHPEDAGLTVRDFNWVLRVIVRPVVRPAA